jgi:hypothetical protein
MNEESGPVKDLECPLPANLTEIFSVRLSPNRYRNVAKKTQLGAFISLSMPQL